MAALRAPCNVSASAMWNGRVQRICVVRPVAVALPRKAAAARPQVRTDSATLAAMPITVDAVEAPAKMVHMLTAESYNDFLADNAEKLVVVDFYAVWCGPCKMIAPELDRMAAESDSSIVFAKMDCGATNESKKLAMSLGIKALPTFHLYRNSRMVDSMTGAKVKALQELITKHA
ncbi:hypothetical protein GPECTOR_3g26 [Gonium pectorale]|uniref:Thioredoxin domain-containing protein n=1 Tax=Gonium pectorale TaxID=33097 RepID=A0A150GYX1_GONPE|nr:hypothetical protein GPECTOR_3g26 [Gonium pectorale]|eukprot:KXZ55106.1 hypothetical protein GPECTOR_3g26 [Gonium pectorale]